MDQRLLLIYNPFAGTGSFKARLGDVVDIFVKAGFSVEVYPTQSPGDAAIKAAVPGIRPDVIVAAGGDGTLDEVITGILKSGSQIPLGYIPVGSTNDFAATLGLSNNIIEAAGDVIGGEERYIDIGLFNNRFFVYVAAFGAFTEVSYGTNQNMKNFFGHSAYLFEGLRRIADIKSYEMEITIGSRVVSGEFIYGMVTNSISIGGMKNLTGKNVLLDDGLFEITLIRSPKNPLELQEIATALIGNVESRLVETFRAPSLSISAEKEVAWTLDGEYGGSFREVRLVNMSRCIALLLDEERDHKKVLQMEKNQ